MFKIDEKIFRVNLTRFTWSPVCYVVMCYAHKTTISSLSTITTFLVTEVELPHNIFFESISFMEQYAKETSVLKISPRKYSFSCYKFLLFNKIFSISPTPSAPVKRQYTLFFYKFSFFRCHILVVSCRICLSLCDLSNLV